MMSKKKKKQSKEYGWKLALAMADICSKRRIKEMVSKSLGKLDKDLEVQNRDDN